MQVIQNIKKLVSVLASSTSITNARKEALVLDYVLYIHYPVQFKRNAHGTQAEALIDFRSKINTMALTYASKLGLKVYPTEFKAQKINSPTLKIFKMVLASFQVKDKLRRARIFQKTFLLADISTEVILGMPFLTLSNEKIQFVEKELTWKFYTTAKVYQLLSG